MTLEDKLNLNDPIELAKAEEKLSKAKAKILFESGFLKTLTSGGDL